MAGVQQGVGVAVPVVVGVADPVVVVVVVVVLVVLVVVVEGRPVVVVVWLLGHRRFEGEERSLRIKCSEV